MNYDSELKALLSQPWSNDACRGYVIAAMERCGFKPSDIEQRSEEHTSELQSHLKSRMPSSA